MFGANYGGATVLHRDPQVATGSDCPYVGRLLDNLKFTLRGESEMMAAILDRHEQPAVRLRTPGRRRMSDVAQGPGSRAWRTFDGQGDCAITALWRRGHPPAAHRRFRGLGGEPQDSRGRCHATVAIDWIKTAWDACLFDGISICHPGHSSTASRRSCCALPSSLSDCCSWACSPGVLRRSVVAERHSVLWCCCSS